MKYLAISFLVAILVALFAMQNSTVVVIKFMQWETNLSVVLLVLISAALGALAMLSPLMFVQLSLRNKLRKSAKIETSLSDEITALKYKLEEATKPEPANQTTEENASQKQS
ncbi:LapA family protein [Selenomonadales bacterium OttesenSCG-928-I06]|nr:LapA family protein [Selenomonadales bacterium OttesenSCG-928-I06]